MTLGRPEQRVSTKWLSAAAYSGMFGFGIVMALLGAVLPILAKNLRFELGRTGELFLVMNAGMLVITFLLGPFVDRFGHKLPLLIAPLFVGGGLSLVPEASSVSQLMGAVLLLGIGGGALNQVTNTLVADLYADERTKRTALNLLGVFFGFGALFVPFIIGSALRILGFSRILFLASGLSLLPLVLSILFAFPIPRQRSGVSASDMLRLLRKPLVLTFAFLLFFESGNEFILGGYISTYLTTHLHAALTAASYTLAAYWASIMLGRVVLSRVALRNSGGVLVRISAAGVAVSTILLLTSRSSAAGLICVILLGLSIATIFPTVLGLAGSRYGNYSGTVFGILIGIALVGGMSMPWFMARIAGHWGIRTALFLVVLNAAAIFCFEWTAERMLRRQEDV